MGRLELARGEATAAVGHFRAALRADRDFVPASVALGDAQEAAGDPREAVRTWERAAETHPVLPLLARLERAYREQDRPSRMIALYRAAAERVPDDLALAAALGRVYFELEMLDEAADQFEKIEVRAPDLPTVHAFLGAIFERRGDTREAFDEYRRALRLAHGFDWPHRCTVCGVAAPRWQDRCDACRRGDTPRPAAARRAPPWAGWPSPRSAPAFPPSAPGAPPPPAAARAERPAARRPRARAVRGGGARGRGAGVHPAGARA